MRQADAELRTVQIAATESAGRRMHRRAEALAYWRDAVETPSEEAARLRQSGEGAASAIFEDSA